MGRKEKKCGLTCTEDQCRCLKKSAWIPSSFEPYHCLYKTAVFGQRRWSYGSAIPLSLPDCCIWTETVAIRQCHTIVSTRLLYLDRDGGHTAVPYHCLYQTAVCGQRRLPYGSAIPLSLPDCCIWTETVAIRQWHRPEELGPLFCALGQPVRRERLQ